MALEQRIQLLEDIQAIIELKSAYCNAADGGWDRASHDYDKMAALFVADGLWDAGKYGRGEGREGIRALFQTFRTNYPFAFHSVSNPIIKVNGDTAEGEWHVLIAISLSPTAKKEAWIGGIYRDQYVRTPEGWRFRAVQFARAFATKNAAGWRVG